MHHTKPDPVNAAFHEAGHCVIAILFGLPLLAVYIKGSGTKWGGVWVDRPKRAYTTRKDTTEFTESDRKELREDVIFLMAGKVAEEVVARRTPHPTWSADDDDDIRSLTRWVFQDDGEGRKQFLDEALGWTRKALSKNEAAVQNLAGELIRKRPRLWGDEVAAIVGTVAHP